MIDSRNLICLTVNISTIILDCMFFIMLLDYLSERKYTKHLFNIRICIFIIILIILNCRDNSCVYVLISCIFYRLNYEVGKIKSIAIPTFFWIIYIDLITPISHLMVIFINYTYKSHLEGSIFAIESILLSYSILILFMLVLKSIMYKRNIFENIKLTLPVITNIVSFLLIFRSTAKYVENIILDNVVVIFTGFIIVLSNIYLLKFIDELIEKHNIKLENKFIKEKINIESKYINNLKENHKRIKILKHDMKNHLICIKNIANDKESLLRYIDNIMLEINKHEQAFNTGNIVLDSILDEKTAICKKHNINLNVDIIFNRNEFMDLIDVCSIFSNSIDNAIEACIKINEERKREIYIKGNYIKDMFILKIENVKLNKVIVKNNKILSDKNDSINHGLGIQSIKNSVKKYMGDVFIDFTSDKFTIKIIIPLKNDNLCK